VEQRVKVLIVGEPGAGKRDIAKGTDVCVPFKSLGVSIGKKIKMKERINYKVTFIFWTLTTGRPQETTYFSGASAAIIVGNLKKRNSIKDMSIWAKKIISELGWIPIFFIGTTIKSGKSNKISELEKLAFQYNSNYFVYSPLRQGSLNKIFKTIAEDLANKYYKILVLSRNAS
jgi:hypothetical protein